MTWASVTMRWPAQATRWLDDLSNAQKLAGGELASTTKRMRDLQGLATTNPGPVGAAAGPAISAGRNAMATTLGQAPACMAVTPFQAGTGQGKDTSASCRRRTSCSCWAISCCNCRSATTRNSTPWSCCSWARATTS